MTINIRGTTLSHFDHQGGAAVTLHTNAGNIGPAHRAFTQSDKNAFFGQRTANPVVPTPVALYDARLDQSAVTELNGNAAEMARRADDGVFTRVNSLQPGGLRIMAGHTPAQTPWIASNDHHWLDASAGSKAHIVGLVAHPLETRDSLEQRLRDAERVMQNKPDDDQRHVAPVISTAAKRFNDLVDYVVERNLPVVGFEFHGLTRIRAPLGYLHRVMERAAVPPWTFALNVLRRHGEGNGSGTLMAARYGIQSIAPSVFYGNPTGDDPSREPADPRTMWWFHQPHGGYDRYQDLHGPENGCPCPNGTGQAFNPRDVGSMLAARRRHETFIHMADQPNYVRSVASQDYTGYVAARVALKASLASLP